MHGNDRAVQEHSVMSSLQLGVVPVTDLIDFNPQFNNERLIFTVGGGAGLLFGIFSILLCWYLTTSSLNLKKRKIGVLRALGAGDADVKRIVLFEALIVAICSFALALLLSLGVFYGSLQPLTYMAQFGVSMLNFTGWNVLILAVLSFTVPILSTLVPLKRFLKMPSKFFPNKEQKCKIGAENAKFYTCPAHFTKFYLLVTNS